jgi:hypothetical protein
LAFGYVQGLVANLEQGTDAPPEMSLVGG